LLQTCCPGVHPVTSAVIILDLGFPQTHCAYSPQILCVPVYFIMQSVKYEVNQEIILQKERCAIFIETVLIALKILDQVILNFLLYKMWVNKVKR
jgi:hypothetical protein